MACVIWRSSSASIVPHEMNACNCRYVSTGMITKPESTAVLSCVVGWPRIVIGVVRWKLSTVAHCHRTRVLFGSWKYPTSNFQAINCFYTLPNIVNYWIRSYARRHVTKYKLYYCGSFMRSDHDTCHLTIVIVWCESLTQQRNFHDIQVHRTGGIEPQEINVCWRFR